MILILNLQSSAFSYRQYNPNSTSKTQELTFPIKQIIDENTIDK